MNEFTPADKKVFPSMPDYRLPLGRRDYSIRPRAVHPVQDREAKVDLVDPDVGWPVPRYREPD
jgi:hypothetical protein